METEREFLLRTQKDLIDAIVARIETVRDATVDYVLTGEQFAELATICQRLGYFEAILSEKQLPLSNGE